MPVTQGRTKFDQKDDAYLVKYIATYNPTKDGRSGNTIYMTLVENAENRWPWSKNHTWQSWRDRYYKHQDEFDHNIKKYQKKHGIQVPKDSQGPGSKRGLTYSHPVQLRQRMEEVGELEEGEILSQRGGEKASNGIPSTSQEKRKTAARKTAAASNGVAPSGPTADDDESGPAADRPRESAVEKRKKVNGQEGRESAKRRKTSDRAVQYDVSDALPVQQSVQDIRDASREEEILEDAPAGSQSNRTPGSPHSQSDSQSQPPLVKKFRESFSALDQLPADQRIKLLRELGLSIASHESTPKPTVAEAKVEPPSERKARANGDSAVAVRYPDLLQELEYWNTQPDVSAHEEDLKGSPVETEQPGQELFLSSYSDQIVDAQGVDDLALTNEPEANPPLEVSIATKPPEASLRTADDDDFFGTPEPVSPLKQIVTTEVGTASAKPASVKSNGPTIENVSTTSSPARATRDPPRLTNGAFRNTYNHVNGKHTASRKKKRMMDLDTSSDSDAGVVANGGARPNGVNWPPKRNKATERANDLPSTTAVTFAVTNAHESRNGAQVSSHEDVTIANGAAEETGSRTEAPRLARLHNVNLGRAKQTTSAPITVAGPSKPAPKANAVASLTGGRSSFKTPIPNDVNLSVPSTIVGDPFITTDHASRLRRLEKGKTKEDAHDDARTTRRLTFGGFSAKQTPLPEVDLRKKSRERNRPSLDWETVSVKAVSPFLRESARRQEALSRAHSGRTSYTTTIDVAEVVPPVHEISPTDLNLIILPGLQYYIQAMAQNHGLPEERVRSMYDECRSLPDADRILGEIRAILDLATEKAIERERQDAQHTVATLPSRATLADEPLEDINSDLEESESNQAKPNYGQEANISRTMLSQPAKSASPRRVELHYTRMDPNEEAMRALRRYAPPSTSRAARYLRRARRSSAIGSSPLKPTSEASKIKNGIDDSDDEEANEVENSPALTRSQAPEDVIRTLSGSSIGKPVEALASPPPTGERGISNGSGSADDKPSNEMAWSAEEDLILERGEDDEAMRTIIERRGEGAVRRRLYELMPE